MLGSHGERTANPLFIPSFICYASVILSELDESQWKRKELDVSEGQADEIGINERLLINPESKFEVI